MSEICKRCRQTFTNEDKLARHLKTAHGGRPNVDLRLRNAAVAVGVVAIVALLVLLMLRDGDPTGETRDANLSAFGLADDPFMGDPDADVVVVAFEAPKCASCQYFHAQILPRLKTDYFDAGRAVFYFTQYTAGYDFDYDGGIAQECAHREGGNDAFWSLTEAIYRDQRRYTAANVGEFLSSLAAEQGLDETRLQTCYQDRETAGLVDADWRLAGDFDVPGTPTFYVFGLTGEPVRASLNDLEDVMKKAGA